MLPLLPLITFWFSVNQSTINTQPACHAIVCEEKPYYERQIEWMKSLRHIEYWLWCKWDNCWRPKYDCMWLVIASWRHVWLYDWKYIYWETWARDNQVNISELKRWDYLFMNNLSWEINHIAIITKWRDWHWVWILDTFEKKTKATERYIRINWNRYAWTYEIIWARRWKNKSPKL